MKKFVTRNKTYIFPAALVLIAGIGFFTFSLGQSSQPLFNNLDNFVLFAQKEIKLEKGVQVSSGDLGSNREISIEKDSIINGNLFADKITLDKDVIINGDISFNKLKTKKETQILGTQTKPVSLPIANLPEIPDFQTGEENFKFEGKDNTLASGTYGKITLEKDSRLMFLDGIYNIERLELKKNATLIFSQPTTLNIKSKFTGRENVSIFPGQNLKPDDLTVNYRGKKEKIEFGKNSFLNFKLLAPESDVRIGEATILRGQILARKIKIEKDAVLSSDEAFIKDTDLNKIVTVNGEKFVVNEIIMVMQEGTEFLDVLEIIEPVQGIITGFVPEPQIYKIEVSANTAEELDSVINIIKDQQSPLILHIIKNLVGSR